MIIPEGRPPSRPSTSPDCEDEDAIDGDTDAVVARDVKLSSKQFTVSLSTIMGSLFVA
jgi:hypothetical protein